MTLPPASAPFDFGEQRFGMPDVLDHAAELLESDNATRRGRATRTLAKGPGMTVVLAALQGGGELQDHAAPGAVMIVPILGTPIFSGLASDDALRLEPGSALFISPGETHHVYSEQDCAFLIIIGDRPQHAE